MIQNKKIAVIIPCFNEALTISKVVSDFKKKLSCSTTIYVVDNASTDGTARIAKASGAAVLFETRKGKGNAVRLGFSEVEADYYVLVDGDGTYDVDACETMLKTLIDNNHDMVVGVRKAVSCNSFPCGHTIGNRLFNLLFRLFFGNVFTDLFSGYRVFSHRFVKSFPAASDGFELETELSVHCVNLKASCSEVETQYFGRPADSTSKLNTISDGIAILIALLNMFRLNKPFYFYSIFSVLLVLLSIVFLIPIFIDYMSLGLVPKQPTLIVCIGMMVVAVVCFFSGLILDNIVKFQYEFRRKAYKDVRNPPPG
jgi:glycosyltransferase involved in cell wall biosynthesis